MPSHILEFCLSSFPSSSFPWTDIWYLCLRSQSPRLPHIVGKMLFLSRSDVMFFSRSWRPAKSSLLLEMAEPICWTVASSIFHAVCGIARYGALLSDLCKSNCEVALPCRQIHGSLQLTARQPTHRYWPCAYTTLAGLGAKTVGLGFGGMGLLHFSCHMVEHGCGRYAMAIHGYERISCQVLSSAIGAPLCQAWCAKRGLSAWAIRSHR